MNCLKEINIKNRAYCFFNDMINVKNLDLNKIKIIEKTYKCILTYYIEYVTIKDLSYLNINSVNPSYLIIYKINGYIEKSIGKKYWTLVPADESKGTLKKSEQL